MAMGNLRTDNMNDDEDMNIQKGGSTQRGNKSGTVSNTTDDKDENSYSNTDEEDTESV